MSENTNKKVGALHSELTIELHTVYAINAWTGRASSALKSSIIGMPQFFRLVSKINQDTNVDNPYADVAMLHIETLISEANQKIQNLLDEADKLIEMLPANISISSAGSSEPLNIGVHSHTPLGYRCVYLLVGFDQLALKLFQAHHYGLISLTHRNSQLHKGGYQIRRIFTVAQRYKSFPVNRSDIAFDTANAQQAAKLFGEIDESVLLGHKRSAYSKPLNKYSDVMTQLLNMKKQLKEKSREKQFNTTVSEPPELSDIKETGA